MEFANAVSNLLKDMQGWLLTVIGAVTTVMVAIHSVKFLMGDSGDKAESVSNIKKTLVMGAGVFFLIWLTGEIIGRFKLI